MIIKNPNNLPEAMVRAAIGDPHYNPSPKRMSVTDLINSPWQRNLKLKHWHETSCDVEDMTWLLMGKAFHMLMDKYSPHGASSEVKLEIPFGDYTLVGIPDVHQDGTLDDYKVTSVYSFILGEKIEWVQQLNTYAWMLRSGGIEVHTARIIAILKDHNMRKTSEEGYPNKPLIAVNVPLWTCDKQKEYIDSRIEAHKKLMPCTPEERWHKDDTYAVKERNIKRAKRVFTSYDAAMEYLIKGVNDGNRNLYVEKREGEDSKCLRYCAYSTYCEHNKYNKEDSDVEIAQED